MLLIGLVLLVCEYVCDIELMMVGVVIIVLLVLVLFLVL